MNCLQHLPRTSMSKFRSVPSYSFRLVLSSKMNIHVQLISNRHFNMVIPSLQFSNQGTKSLWKRLNRLTKRVINVKISKIFILEIFRFSMAYGKDRESFLCEIKPIEFQNSTCDFENTDFEDDLSSSSSIPPAESLIASKIAGIPKGDIVSVQILDEKFIFICKKRQESLLK